MSGSDTENDSWLNVPATQDITPWSDGESVSNQLPTTANESEAHSSYVPSHSNSASMRHLRDLGKRLRSIYIEEGKEYKEPKTDDEICERFREAITMRRNRIQKIFNGIRLARNVDLLFLIDVTGSMQRHFNATREAVFRIVDALLETDGDAQVMKMRLGLLGYRDHTDEVQFVRLAFTESPEEFRNYCKNIICTGGADAAEDVLGGLDEALKMDWDTRNFGTRLIFHICDSPAHGLQYHKGNLTDNYPGGDPKNRKHEDLFKRMADEEIHYHFGRINDTTDKMLEVFEEGLADKISVFDITKVEDIAASVVSAVHESVWTSSKRASTATTNEKGERLREREYTFVRAEPVWSEIENVKGTFLAYESPRNIDDIIEDVPLKRKNPEEALIQIAKNPFAKGVERVAFYGRDNSPYFFMARTTNVVFKEFAHEYKGGKSRRFEVANHLQTIAAYLANRFCEDLRRQTGKRMTVEFLKTKTLIIKEEDGQNRYLACEKRFAPDTKFIRFTNNVNYTILESKARELSVPLDYVELLMAFSHWTYKITDGMLMVVDLQGIVQKDENKTKIVLTDPAIHCIDSTRYGAMNLGRKGMDKFLERHKCNVYCEGLKLNK